MSLSQWKEIAPSPGFALESLRDIARDGEARASDLVSEVIVSDFLHAPVDVHTKLDGSLPDFEVFEPHESAF